jgi:hypothetical protein
VLVGAVGFDGMEVNRLMDRDQKALTSKEYNENQNDCQ